jgi:hypothetical protein
LAISSEGCPCACFTRARVCFTTSTLIALAPVRPAAVPKRERPAALRLNLLQFVESPLRSSLGRLGLRPCRRVDVVGLVDGTVFRTPFVFSFTSAFASAVTFSTSCACSASRSSTTSSSGSFALSAFTASAASSWSRSLLQLVALVQVLRSASPAFSVASCASFSADSSASTLATDSTNFGSRGTPFAFSARSRVGVLLVQVVPLGGDLLQRVARLLRGASASSTRLRRSTSSGSSGAFLPAPERKARARTASARSLQRARRGEERDRLGPLRGDQLVRFLGDEVLQDVAHLDAERLQPARIFESSPS